MTDEQVETIAEAIRSISHGPEYGPGGLEALAMSLSQEGPLSQKLQDGLDYVAMAMSTAGQDSLSQAIITASENIGAAILKHSESIDSLVVSLDPMRKV